MSTRLRRFLAWHAMAIAVLISQPLAAEEKWWEKDPVLEYICFKHELRDIEERCKAGDVLVSIDLDAIHWVCDYRYSILVQGDQASCVYLGHNREIRFGRTKPD
jgi:hypothetical protein